MNPATHLKISTHLCGSIITLEENMSSIRLHCTGEMAVDERGLVHGGFVFGLADYAAMMAVNHSNVVLASATAHFIKPVRVGEDLIAHAHVDTEGGRKRSVKVTVSSGDETVFTGIFSCAVLDTHVLENRP